MTAAEIDPHAPRSLLEHWPQLRGRLRFERIGTYPTPVDALTKLTQALGHPDAELYEKRDDLTSPIYGGNKIRTLEVLFGDALNRGATDIISTGAYGSNHAAATALHAPRVGLTPGICVYPQPISPAALDNLQLVLSRDPRPPVTDLPHWSALPYGIWKAHRDAARRGARAYVMEPGGAVPLGALGYVSAALELAEQVERKELPAPREVVVATGSNCTAAGLLLGFSLAAERGLGFDRPPLITAVRVTPWPVTIPLRIVGLATTASRWLAALSGDASTRRTSRRLRQHLRVTADFLGKGYGFATAAGHEAVAQWDEHVGHPLETNYSAKSGAAVLARIRAKRDGPLMFWSTKSSAPLPPSQPEDSSWAPARMQRWMQRARKAHPHHDDSCQK